ncbi:MgtC/SapB family protein [Paenibacillus sp. J2TS4]|uniref:MgtC/SapB family protein n=1 Tax=Paenibacillus sp. J2TS4 TaxID=2807194 RepID=UPI001B1CC6C6|nr:MgtC/SapB family protein [Paenibacillus sp. J2TS4]GIP35456.1 magnesium transporter MgtC [Paenibacillus sp. J2TS4]
MDPWHIEPFDLTLRLILALFLGGLIGLEREKNNHPAGLRTHILVCVGSALLMLLSMYGFSAFVDEGNVRLDPARLAAQVIPGIGFLGAGTIIRNGFSVMGLTTAASLWVAAAIGLSVGAGFYYASFLSTALVLISLWTLNIVEKKYFENKQTYWLKLVTKQKQGTLAHISANLERRGIAIRQISMEESDWEQSESADRPDRLTLSILIRVSKPELLIEVTEEMKLLPGMERVGIETA